MAESNHRPPQGPRHNDRASNSSPRHGHGGGTAIHTNLPLYGELSAAWNPPIYDSNTPGLYLPGGVLPKDAHHGLYWERFFHGYNPRFDGLCEGDKRHDIPPAKSRFIFGFDKREVGTHDALSQSAQRLHELAKSLGGECFDAINDWRFATGMGQEHPTENGLVFHRTLGTPYLPGSGVKGLLRGYLEWLHGVKPDEAAPAEITEQLQQWFGSPHKDPKQWPEGTDSQSGWFVFFDALPVEPVRLRADVMTPHYGDWYEKGGQLTSLDPEIVPADWHSPNPIVFLVAEKIQLRFAVAPRPGLGKDAEAAQAMLPKVIAALKDALAEFGAGAKTAVGYGLFKVPGEDSEL